MTIEDAAKSLSLNPLTLRRWPEMERYPAFKLGRQWRFKRELLERWVPERSEGNSGTNYQDEPGDTTRALFHRVVIALTLCQSRLTHLSQELAYVR